MARRSMAVGDLLTFKAATRDSFRKATRVITAANEIARRLNAAIARATTQPRL